MLVNPGAIASNLGPVVGKSNCGSIFFIQKNLEVTTDNKAYYVPMLLNSRCILGSIRRTMIPLGDSGYVS